MKYSRYHHINNSGRCSLVTQALPKPKSHSQTHFNKQKSLSHSQTPLPILVVVEASCSCFRMELFFFWKILNNFPFQVRLQDLCYLFIFKYAHLSLPSFSPQLLVFDKVLPAGKQDDWNNIGDSCPLKYMACTHFRIISPPQPKLAMEACHLFLLFLLSPRLCTWEILILGAPEPGPYPQGRHLPNATLTLVNFFISLQKLFLSIFLLQLGWVGERTQREVEADGCHKLHTAIEN